MDVTSRKADLALGMEIGGNAEIRLIYARGYVTVDEQIGQPVAPEGAVHQGGIALQLVHDSLDDTFFPVRAGSPGSGAVLSGTGWALTAILMR